jgi:hypothetical protein
VALLVAPHGLEVHAIAPRTALGAPGTPHQAPSTIPAPSTFQEAGLILGRVLDASTGQPMTSAVVRLSAGGVNVGQGVLTGADGRFVFAPLPAGTFTVTAERPGYFDSAYGSQRPRGVGQPIAIAAGERRGDLTIQMWPWASIAGTVVDEVGARVPNITVEAIRRGPKGAASTGEVITGVTDARGDFRIQRLAPGSYAVGVGSRVLYTAIPPGITLPASAVTPPATGSGDPTLIVDATRRLLISVEGPVRQPRDPREFTNPFVYVMSYYGGATNLWQATPVVVTAGQQVASINLPLALRTSVRVAGTVMGPRGPVAQALVRLLPTDFDPDEIDMDTASVAAAITGDDGKFTLPPVAAGNYLIDAFRPRPAPTVSISSSGVPRLTESESPSRDPEGYWARTSVSVTNLDIPNMVLTMRAGARLSGEMVFQKPPSAGAQPFKLLLHNAGDPPVMSADIRLDRVGSFAISGIKPGSYVLDAAGLPPGWEITSAVLNGREITGMPFDIGGTDVTGLVVTLGDRAIEIRGDVLDAQGRLALDSTVVIFPTEMGTWKSVPQGSRHIQAIRAANGGYAFRGLSAGDYYVAAIDDAMMADWPATELLRKLMNSAERVRVATGERRVVNLVSRPRR